MVVKNQSDIIIFKNFIIQYNQQSHWDNNQLGSGFVFHPSDQDELVDQLKLLYFEKVGGRK